MGSGYFKNQRLSDALQVNKNEYNAVFFFHKLTATDIMYFMRNFPNNEDLELLDPVIPYIELQNYDVNRIEIVNGQTNGNIFTPNMNLWRGYNLVCLVFRKPLPK